MGSGTTLLAAERCGRAGYGTEIKPGYIDVRRWMTITDGRATTPTDRAAAGLSSGCLVRFAKTGNPNGLVCPHGFALRFAVKPRSTLMPMGARQSSARHNQRCSYGHPSLRMAIMYQLLKHAAACVVALAIAAALPARAQLTAGTGKADITPPAAMFPFDNGTGDAPFSGVHDRLSARALVLDQDGTRTVIVAADMINMPDAVFDRVVARIAARFGVDRQRIWISATHVHTVPWTLARGYEQVISDGIVAAVADAAHAPEPVRIGSGTGRADINVNRDEQTANGFILGQDPSGKSDKAVRVVGFFRRDRTPKAILANYAVHAVVLHSSVTGPGHSALVSADLPGATNASVDAHYPGTMTFWTSGAAADQNPVMMSIYAEPGADGLPVLTDLKSAGFALVERWGQNLGLAITRVVDAMRPRPLTKPIKAAGTVVSCPAISGEKPRSIRVSWLQIGPVDLLGISGELGTPIDAHLRTSLAKHDLITLTLTNGYAGYLPGDASFARGRTFEVEHSSIAPGCAENAIIKAATKLIAR